MGHKYEVESNKFIRQDRAINTINFQVTFKNMKHKNNKFRTGKTLKVKRSVSIVWSHLYEISRTGKSTETENRFAVAWRWWGQSGVGGGIGEWLLQVSFGDAEYVLK